MYGCGYQIKGKTAKKNFQKDSWGQTHANLEATNETAMAEPNKSDLEKPRLESSAPG